MVQGVPLITAAQAAEILDVDVQQIYNLASRGHLNRHAPGHARLAYDLGRVSNVARGSGLMLGV